MIIVGKFAKNNVAKLVKDNVFLLDISILGV